MQRFMPAALVTLGIAALAFAGGSTLTRAGIVGATDVPTMPRAKDMVTIRGGGPYVVPDGYRLVLQSVNHRALTNTKNAVFIYLDGATGDDYDLEILCEFAEVADLPKSYALPSGTSVLIARIDSANPQPSPDWIATGYLERDH